MLTIKCEVEVAVGQDEALGIYVSYCPALELYSQGENQEEALMAIIATVEGWIRLCFRRGILKEALERRGFVCSQHVTRQPEWKTFPPEASKEFTYKQVVEVPWPLFHEDRTRGITDSSATLGPENSSEPITTRAIYPVRKSAANCNQHPT